MGQKTFFFKKPYLYQASVDMVFFNFTVFLIHFLVQSFSDHLGHHAELSIKPRTTQNGASENLKIFNSSTDPSSAEYKVLGKSPIVFHIVKGRGTVPALGNLSTRTKTKTKTPRHRQRQIQSASKTQCMLYLSKAGGSTI